VLILSRHRDEDIVIGHGPGKITVRIVDIRGDKVRLGIDAPKDMPVHRSEVYQAILNQDPNRLEGPGK
jgi:carbon storage regulator